MKRAAALDALPTAPPRYLEPMKCRLQKDLPQGPSWVYEIKFDGYRGLTVKTSRATHLYSRNQKDLGPKFPEILDALRDLPATQCVLDGELVALDPSGRSSFQSLQRLGDPGFQDIPLYYYLFDLLNLEGRDTISLPLHERKTLLKNLLKKAPPSLRFSDILPGTPEEVTRSMQHLNLEGLIAKDRTSSYQPGQRTGAWIKHKWAQEQEFVIGGYTRPAGSRPYFGALLVGYYQDGKLLFAGKVGTGFDHKRLKSLHQSFQEILTPKTPFANLPERNGVITAAQMRSCHWVRPQLVCQVRFTEWTADHHLRQPVFLGLRDDKSPRDVIREIPT